MAKFNFKKGDIVEVIAGDDKGTKAELLQVMPKKNKVIVKGLAGGVTLLFCTGKIDIELFHTEQLIAGNLKG